MCTPRSVNSYCVCSARRRRLSHGWQASAQMCRQAVLLYHRLVLTFSVHIILMFISKCSLAVAGEDEKLMMSPGTIYHNHFKFTSDCCVEPTDHRPFKSRLYISFNFKNLWKNMYIRLFDFVTKNEILSPHQYGFKLNRSTYMAINDLYFKITDDVDNKPHSLGIFLDLSKAFDTLNHNTLLHKLNIYDISGLPNSCIQNYLFNRKQYVA